MTSERIEQLGLTLMSTNKILASTRRLSRPQSRRGRAVTTGISVPAGYGRGTNPGGHRRLKGRRISANAPGHVVSAAPPPHRARSGAAAGPIRGRPVDILAAGGTSTPRGVICEIMNEGRLDGGGCPTSWSLLRPAPQPSRSGTDLGTLISYRRRHDNARAGARRNSRSKARFGGTWTLRIYTDETQGAEHNRSGERRYLGARARACSDACDGPASRRGGHPGRRARARRVWRRHEADRRRGGAGCSVLLRDLTMKLSPGDEVSPQTLRQ